MSSAQDKRRLSVPTTGMRGGLGRRLLTAFLVMTIGPLGVLSWYAGRSGRSSIGRQVITKLSTVAAATELRLREWAESRSRAMDILASGVDVRANCAALCAGTADSGDGVVELRDRLEAFLATDPAYLGVSLLCPGGQLVLAAGEQPDSVDPPTHITGLNDAQSTFRITSLDPAAQTAAVVVQPVESPSGEPVGSLVGWLARRGVEALLESVVSMGEGGRLYVVDGTGMALPQGKIVRSHGMGIAVSADQAEGFYENPSGVPVIGVHRAMPDLGLVLVAEQPEDEAFAAADRVTAAIVAAALVVALVTSVIAAVVTRQITGPVVRLTESALLIAEGDLEQRVDVDSRDEIGILANVFNLMVTELASLYDGLEAKVAQRTGLLREANSIVQRRAVQLAATVEISRVVASILDAGELLHRVVYLVRDRFAYDYVGVYLLADDGARAELKAGTGGDEALGAPRPRPVVVGGDEAVWQAVVSREPIVVRASKTRGEVRLSEPHTLTEVALPLIVRDDMLGVLSILTVDPERIDGDTLSILRSVASQVAIALDNARVYRNEREARERLKQAEDVRSRFLSNMSRELREPLTNIIGFCRLILKGVDGPISEQQRQDLRIIYASSEHLLGLINDLLDVSQIEAGLMELRFQDLDLQKMITSLMATASALVRDKDVELRQDVASLPLVRADSTRIRQVLLKLITNAVKVTEKGCISVQAWVQDNQVFVSVSDSGKGIPPEDQKRIFEQSEQGTTENGRRRSGTGPGLALTRQFVEMHGGEIWVDSQVGKGSTFTLALPLSSVAEQPQSPRMRRSSEGG